MKISEIHIYRHELPVKNAPYKMALSDVWSVSTVIVKVVADNGLYGWGETCPLGPTYSESHFAGAVAALREMAPGLIGTEALPIPLHRRMEELLNGHNYAKAAIDIAVHDLLGKKFGISISELLGGALMERIPSYYAISISSPDEAARIATEKLAEGYPRLQVKVGGREVEEDIETLHKIWEVIRGSGTRLAADGNRSMTTSEALQLSRECLDIPLILEQPCNTIEDLQKIRPQVTHGIYMDEASINLNTVITAAGTGLVDGFGMKITRMGGLHQMRTFRDICAARNLPHTCDDAWGGDILAAACAHVGATVSPHLLEGVWVAASYIDGNYDSENGIRIEEGHIVLPRGTGLGITPNESLFGEPIFSY